MNKRLITESDIQKLLKKGESILALSKDDLVTPSAWDKIKEKKIKVIQKESTIEIESSNNSTEVRSKMFKVAIGSDHTGFKLKNLLSKLLSEKGYNIIDVGTYDEKSCDFPDFAYAVAVKVKENAVDFGIILDASGNPSAISANKLPGIRAANCYNEFSAKSARSHNNANILTIGAKAIGEETAKSILETWLKTDFEGGRHQKRLNKITAIEKEFLK